jgi:thioredoxin reductase (NADPH)
MSQLNGDILDCLVVGGGPAGLTAAIYLGRFGRRFLVVDAGDPRAAWIPVSHNIPFFGEGIPGPKILERQRGHAGQYGTRVLPGTVTELRKTPGGRFEATVEEKGGGARRVEARRVLLAAGSVDVEPDLPDLPDAVRRGLVRYCPICDGYEARGRRTAVIGHGARRRRGRLHRPHLFGRRHAAHAGAVHGRPGARGAATARRTGGEDRRATHRGARRAGRPDRGAAHRRGQELRFDALYSALGLRYRTDLARALGAEHDAQGALIVDAHNQTSVKGLYAAGDVVRGLDQIVVAMGHAAVAATHIHNRCELPTEEEPDEARRSRTG